MNSYCAPIFPKLCPPFSSPTSDCVPSIVSASLSIAYARLSAVSSGSLGPIETWLIKDQKWFTNLLSSSFASGLPDIEMSEAPLPGPIMHFVEWLNGEIRHFSGREQFAKGLHQGDKVLRNHRMYSYETRHKIDLEFYDARHSKHGLMLLAEGDLYGSIDPLLKSLVRYAHFTAIHPFRDGNGRASRLLLISQLSGLELWNCLPLPIGFLLHRDRSLYIKRIREALLANQWNDYFIYMLNALSAACELSAIVRYIHADVYGAQQ